MPLIRLRPTLPNGDANGLKDHADLFVDSPDTARLALVLLDTKTIAEDRDDAQVTAHVRIRRVEVITRADDVKELQRIMLRANESRTGKTVLPFETEKAVEDAFADFSTATDDETEGETTND